MTTVLGPIMARYELIAMIILWYKLITKMMSTSLIWNNSGSALHGNIHILRKGFRSNFKQWIIHCSTTENIGVIPLLAPCLKQKLLQINFVWCLNKAIICSESLLPPYYLIKKMFTFLSKSEWNKILGGWSQR